MKYQIFHRLTKKPIRDHKTHGIRTFDTIEEATLTLELKNKTMGAPFYELIDVTKATGPLRDHRFDLRYGMLVMYYYPITDGSEQKARCSDCGRVSESKEGLPFLKKSDLGGYDSYYCGCKGWS